MFRPIALIFIFVATCNHQGQLERNFFKYPRKERVERMRQYSLEDQYKIFRYGNDKIEPPDLGLADPIAQRGAAAIPFLIEQLKSSADDFAVRDIFLILKSMMYFRSYDVKGDAALKTVLEQRISAMKNREWQAYSREQFENIWHSLGT